LVSVDQSCVEVALKVWWLWYKCPVPLEILFFTLYPATLSKGEFEEQWQIEVRQKGRHASTFLKIFNLNMLFYKMTLFMVCLI